MRAGIRTVLEKEGYAVVSAANGPEGSRLFKEHNPDLVITDLKLPGKGGMHLLNEFQEARPGLPVILISAYGTIDLAVNALKSGARDFIAKPFSIDELKAKVADAFTDQPPAKVETGSIPKYYGMVGSSVEMAEIKERIGQVAQVDSPVLISGESGTGKELIAHAIHKESRRKGKVFLAVNCGAFTDTLLESELFGHEKGSFTGASQQHKGIFEQAHGGTILLDEIGEISPQLQVKLLRVLQDQSFIRLGGSEQISTDARVLSATNRDLKQAIRAGRFREDLYFRLNVLPIPVPPLRERKSDIADLVAYLVKMKCGTLQRQEPEISVEAVEKLQRYAWPGNIRELENLLERLLIFSNAATITADEIYFDDEDPVGIGNIGNLPEVLEDTEYRMIKQALERSGGVKQKAARLLGIKPSALYYKLEKYGLINAGDSPGASKDGGQEGTQQG